MSKIDVTLIVFFALFVVLAATVLRILPGKTGEFVLFASPWAPDSEVFAVVARAGGQIVAGTALPWAIVVRSDQSDFVSRLYHSGAVFVADPVTSRACGGSAAASRLKGYTSEPA